jgi:negative regulator of flagellin synthesis FlgM
MSHQVMSTKIDSTPGLPPKLSASMDKLAPAKLAQSAYSGAASDAAAGSSRGADTVQITGDAMKLQSLEKSLSGSSSFDAKRVAEVRAAIADGRYRVNPDRIASRMIDSDAQLG